MTDGAGADKRVACQAYRGAVVAALGEAETAYGLIAAADRELLAATTEFARAERAASLADTRFRAGLSSSSRFPSGITPAGSGRGHPPSR